MRRDTGCQQLFPVRLAQIDVRSTLFPEVNRHFRTYLVATLADTRPDGGMHIGRVGFESLCHCRQDTWRNLCSCSAPPRMHCGDRVTLLVYQQNRHAVCRLDGNDCSRRIFQKRVAFAQCAASATRIHPALRMDLLQCSQIGEERRNVGVSRAETVLQPLEAVEFALTVDLLRI